MSDPGSDSSDRYIVGFHPCRELLRSRPGSAATLLVAESRGGSRRDELETLARRSGVPIRTVSLDELERLASAEHNGFAVELVAGENAEAKGVGADPGLVVLLEDVQDPGNLGALLRVCEGAGVGEVLIRDRGSAPLNAAAIKASAGAAEWVQIERITNSAQELSRRRDGGFWIYGADADGVPPWEIDLTGRVLLCLGGEHRGLRRLTRESCDGLVGLPMRGRVESLNVATAAAALLYEAIRQRSKKR